MHVDQMQEEVSTQVATDDVSAAVLSEQHDGLMHLVVRYETTKREHFLKRPVFFFFLNSGKSRNISVKCAVTVACSGVSRSPVLHYMQVPQLHHLLLSLVDVCELI